MQQNQDLNTSVIYQRVRGVIDKNKASDLFQKAFLRPQQIALKTWRTEGTTVVHSNALPFGLKQIIKKDISNDNLVMTDFQPFSSLKPEQRTFQYITQNNYDNLISLMKPASKEQKIQLCICICMYSEDKTMLRKTLAGVSNNIATFVKNGVPADDIAVVVVMDGIEMVHQSVIDFFGEMQKESNIYLDDEVTPLGARDLVKQDYQTDEEEVININSFIFDPIQLQDRKKRRFASRISEYKLIKATQKKIQQLQVDKNITFYDLDQFLKPFFFEKAKEYYKRQMAEQNFADESISEQFLIQKYADKIKLSRPIIYQALGSARYHCDKYIQTRESLALLNSYRVDVTFGSFDQKDVKKKDKKQYDELNQEEKDSPMVKMNLFLITKYKNSGKLTSHNWFFNGFCKEVWPEFAVLLDVGLCPEKTALFKMYSHMKRNERCGGVCGYMNLRIERLEDEDEKHYGQVDCLSRIFLHFADIQRAQQVEYHFAHLIDKPFEALFKFIHVLPGAFSAYRMSALKLDEKQGSDLMRAYFKSIEEASQKTYKTVQYSTGKAILKVLLPDFLFYCCYPLPEQESDQQLLYDENVYLAEDRTLCMGIHQNNYDLEYLPDAHAWVDPIKSVHGLLGQRKRWINGSFFAFENVKSKLKRGSSSRGDCCLGLQILYLNLMNMLAFVSPALFLFTVHIAMFAFRDWFFGYILDGVNQGRGFQTTQLYNSFVYVVDFIYVMMMLGLIFKSIHFTHKTQRFIPYIYAVSTIMGMFSIAVFIVLFVDMVVGIIDTLKCAGSSTCEISFLASIPVLRNAFFNALPGGTLTFIIYKYVVVGVLAIYIIPITIYAVFFCKCEFVGDVLFGAFSFLFYTPTYLNILNTFALCRIDDISWGTKGLDTETNKNQSMKQSWKSIKIIHVAKYVFWNIVVGAAMLAVSSPINLKGLITSDEYNALLIDSYVRKFFMTFFLMVVIGGSFFFKVILGAMYSISYRCRNTKLDSSILKGDKTLTKIDSRVDRFFGLIKGSMFEQLKANISQMVDEAKQNKKLTKGGFRGINMLMDFIRNNGKSFVKAKQKWDRNVESRSKVLKKTGKKPGKGLFETETTNQLNFLNTTSLSPINPSDGQTKDKKSDQEIINSETQMKKSSQDLQAQKKAESKKPKLFGFF